MVGEFVCWSPPPHSTTWASREFKSVTGKMRTEMSRTPRPKAKHFCCTLGKETSVMGQATAAESGTHNSGTIQEDAGEPSCDLRLTTILFRARSKLYNHAFLGAGDPARLQVPHQLEVRSLLRQSPTSWRVLLHRRVEALDLRHLRNVGRCEGGTMPPPTAHNDFARCASLSGRSANGATHR